MKLIDFTQVENIFIVCGKTDMRRQIDGLAATITEEYDMDVYNDALFLFCGGNKDRFKALYWEGDGFLRKRVITDRMSNKPISLYNLDIGLFRFYFSTKELNFRIPR